MKILVTFTPPAVAFEITPSELFELAEKADDQRIKFFRTVREWTQHLRQEIAEHRGKNEDGKP